MKRLIGLSVAVILGVTLTITMLIPKDAKALGGQLFGDPQGLGFDIGLLVETVRVRVSNGWLESDTFSLAISIASNIHIDDYGNIIDFIDHGSAVVPLRKDWVFAGEKAIVDLDIPWDTDIHPRTDNEVYTVFVQILVNGKPVGDVMYNLPPWNFTVGGPEI